MADGMIKFKTAIDTKGFEDDAKRMKMAWGSTAKEIENNIAKTEKKLEAANKKMYAAEDQYKAQKQKLKEFKAQYDMGSPEATKNAIIGAGKGDEYAALKRSVAAAREEFKSAEAEAEQLYRLLETAPQKGAISLDNYTGKVKYLKSELARLSYEGQGVGDAEYDNVAADLAAAEAALKNYQKTAQKTATTQESVNVKTSKFSTALGWVKTAGLKAANGAKRVATGIANAGSRMVQAAKQTKTLGGTFDKLTGKLSRFKKMFSLMLIRMAIRGTLEQIKQGFQDVIKFSEPVNKSVSAIKGSFVQLRDQLAASLQPVIINLTPIILRFTDILINAADKLAQFFAILSGKDTYLKAKKGVYDYAAGLDKSEKSAKKLNKQLAKWDELNNITTTSDSGSDAGTGVNEPGGFDEVAVDNKFVQMIDEWKKKLSNFWAGFSAPFSDEIAAIKTNAKSLFTTFQGIWNDLKSLGSPIKEWWNTSGMEALQTRIETIAHIVAGTMDTINMVISDTWNNFVMPIVNGFVNDILPVISGVSTQLSLTWRTLFDSIKSIVDTVWTGGVVPVLKLGADIITDVFGIIKKNWDEYGEPIFTALREAINNIKESFLQTWNGVIKPCWDELMKAADEIWNEHLKPLVDNIMGFVGDLVLGAIDIYNKFIAPIVMWVRDKLYPIFVQSFKNIINVVKPIISGIIDAVNGIITVLRGIVRFITGVFTGNWKQAWEGIKQIFKGVWDTLKAVIKTPINACIAMIENFVNNMIKGINKVTGLINKLQFDVPDWVPVIGGEHVGLDIKPISSIKIPRLANGMVVPKSSSEFAAILGDNNKETEIVSPLSTIRQALTESLTAFFGNRITALHATLQRIDSNLSRSITYLSNIDNLSRAYFPQLSTGRVIPANNAMANLGAVSLSDDALTKLGQIIRAIISEQTEANIKILRDIKDAINDVEITGDISKLFRLIKKNERLINAASYV